MVIWGTFTKATIELPDDLPLQAKRKALETRTTLRHIMERALRQELREGVAAPGAGLAGFVG